VYKEWGLHCMMQSVDLGTPRWLFCNVPIYSPALVLVTISSSSGTELSKECRQRACACCTDVHF
jgi:hypothetical protein